MSADETSQQTLADIITPESTDDRPDQPQALAWDPRDKPVRRCLNCYENETTTDRKVAKSASDTYGDEDGNVPVCRECWTGRHGDRELKCDSKAVRLFLERGGADQ